jgi:glycosyltransferase involved in cell wall biosynthesis
LKTISLLHPFTAKAIGLQETDLLFSHSKPHVLALQAIRVVGDLDFTIDYFTGSFLKKEVLIEGVKKRFWPVTAPLLKPRHLWRKQYSKSHFNFVANQTPDITIINMSGHGSRYVFDFSELLLKKNKPYIAMIGGMNMSYDGKALTYYQNAHHIIVHTEIQKKELLLHFGFTNLDIRVLPLGIDTAFFKPKDTFQKSEGKLLFVGRISRLKQIEIAIEALNYLKKTTFENPKLTVVGPISDLDYFKELNILISKLDIVNNIEFIGSVPHEQLIYYYQNCDILLLPSEHESFGMVMTEAMACGVPVVALKGAGGPDEIITSQVDGILTTPENYAKAVHELLSDAELLQSMKKNARAKVLEKYSIEETTRVLLDSVNSVLS